jgi:proliferating cell nuclear antigen
MSVKIFEAKSVQTSNVKTLFEVLKKIVSDINLIITDEYIKIVHLNKASTVSLIHVKLYGKYFEMYKCNYSKNNPLIVGLHTQNLFKIIKTIKHDETISFYMLENDSNFYIQKENNDRNNITSYKLKLHHIPYDNFQIETISYDTTIFMPSAEFQKLCKDYDSLGYNYIEIKNIHDQLFLNGIGDFCSSESVYGSSDNTIFDVKNKNNIIQGKYNMEYLLLFSKASSLSKIVEIYLKNDKPLTLNYKVGTLGDMKFIIGNI